jgi:hypothetical protein
MKETFLLYVLEEVIQKQKKKLIKTDRLEAAPRRNRSVF